MVKISVKPHLENKNLSDKVTGLVRENAVCCTSYRFSRKMVTTEYKETSLLSRRHAQFLLAGVMKEEAAYFRDVGVICM